MTQRCSFFTSYHLSLNCTPSPATQVSRHAADPSSYLGVQALPLPDALLLLPELLLAALPLLGALLPLLLSALLLCRCQLPAPLLVLSPQLADRLLSGGQTGPRRRLGKGRRSTGRRARTAA